MGVREARAHAGRSRVTVGPCICAMADHAEFSRPRLCALLRMIQPAERGTCLWAECHCPEGLRQLTTRVLVATYVVSLSIFFPIELTLGWVRL